VDIQGKKIVWTPAGGCDNNLNRLTKNAFRNGFDPVAGATETRIEMKLTRYIFLALLTLNASAQPASPPSTAAKAPPSPAPGQPTNPRMPPGLMHPQPAVPAVMPDKDKLSYAIGFNIATSVKRDALDVDVDAIAAAMKDVLAGRPTRMDEKEVKTIMTQFQQAMRAKASVEREKLMTENKAKGEEYLAKNAKAPGVTVLTDGIQYKVLKEGTGPMPKPTDTVIVAYKGSLVDGKVFDENAHFPTPVTGKTIKGWSAVLPLMKTGSKWEVTIPSDLGYGPRGYQGKIGPNSVLIFEMELLSISAPSAAPPAMRPGNPPSSQSPTFAHAPTPGQLPPSPPGAPTGVVSGQIIKVPSADELKKGAKIEVITNVPNAQ
jgi:FKBP-type peptidyl-prolyl cis-trans isomerase